jgi:hypothetical protein
MALLIEIVSIFIYMAYLVHRGFSAALVSGSGLDLQRRFIGSAPGFVQAFLRSSGGQKFQSDPPGSNS